MERTMGTGHAGKLQAAGCQTQSIDSSTGAVFTVPNTAHTTYYVLALGANVHLRSGASLADASSVVDKTAAATAHDNVAFNGIPRLFTLESRSHDTIAALTDSGTADLYVEPYHQTAAI